MIGRTKGGIYVCMSSSEMAPSSPPSRWRAEDRSTFIVWAKNTFTLRRSDYQRQYEPILYR